MIKVIDLSDAQKGDKLWSSIEGEVTVEKVDSTAIWFKGRCWGLNEYYHNGKNLESDEYPSLFRSYKEFREYWDFVSFKESVNEKE